MNNKWKNQIFGCVVIALLILASNCGTQNHIEGYLNGVDYRATIRNVDAIAGVALVDPGIITGYSSTDFSLTINMSLDPYWGQFPDAIVIWVPDVRVLEPQVYYSIGGPDGIGAKMTIDGSPMSPTGTIMFSKISQYYSKKVCGEFEFYVADGYAGYFWGSFCGDVSVGYDY